MRTVKHIILMGAFSLLGMSGLLLVTELANAAEDTSAASTSTSLQGTTQTGVDLIEEKPETPFVSGLLAYEYETNLQPYGSATKAQTSSIALNPAFHLGGDYKLAVFAVMTEDHESLDQPKVQNTKIYAISPKFKINDSLNFNPRIGGWAPTNEDAYEKKSYRGAIEIEPQIGFSTTAGNLPLSGFYRLSLRQNLHQYRFSNTGSVNEEHRITHRLAGGLSVLSWLTVSLDARLSSSRSYYGNWKERYVLGQSLDFSIQENLGVSLAHSNGGSLFKADGATSDFNVFDENNSSVLGTVSYGF